MAANFDIKERLGTGNFGEVWKVIDTGLNTTRALKLISPKKLLNPINIFQEAQILKAAEHPNVVRVAETGTMKDGRIYVAMEYLKKGSIEDESRGTYVELTRVQRIMIDVLRGLQHAHDIGIIHRDIKPANILVGNNGEGKLSDFGLAIPRKKSFRTLSIKDYAYVIHLAPEVIQKRQYSVMSDIYAAGVTLYRLVNGDSYLPILDTIDIQNAIISGQHPNRTLYRDFVPRSLRILINKSIDVNPKKRFKSADEMRHALEPLTLQMNWHEQKLSNGFRWSSGWNKKCYEVTRIQDRFGTWSVETKKGSSKKSLRRINSLCHKELNKKKAEQISRRILQDYVLNKIK